MYLRWTPEDRYVALVRMSFFSGSRRCLAALFLGTTIVINRARSAQDFVQLVQEALEPEVTDTK